MPRTYKSINISEEQQRFIRLLDDFEIEIFNLGEIESLVGVKFQNLNIVLENLASKNFLTRIERGKYCRSNFRNENVIGCFLAKEGTVSYWSALNKHGLTSRFPNSIFIQTAYKKKEKIAQGTLYKFIWVSPGKMTGIITEGYGNNAFRITDIEKTIIDCFDLPEYSGGLEELLPAFANADLSGEKLIEYSKAVHNKAALKRMGFISELLDKKGMKSFIRYAKSELNNSYDVFDTLGERTGEPMGAWKLRMNMTIPQIIATCNFSEK
jgi:predicted transcriptional regulator of viral defense system